MARKRMKSKIQPAVQTLFFSSPPIPSEGSDEFYIDLSQCASLMNRRFYRQGLNWAVARMRISGTSFEGGITVSKLPNTWVMSNAWEKAFRAWQKMIKNATEDSQTDVKGKFLDFKIYADEQHHLDGFDANLLPIDSAGNAATEGQWQPSEIEIPDYGPGSAGSPGSTTTFELVAVGPNTPGAGASGFDAKSLIAGYANSRALPYQQDPNVPGGASDAAQNWMMSIFNEGTAQDSLVIDTLEVTGDKAPYPFENDGTHTDTMYPGGETNLPALQVHSFEFVTPTTIGGQTTVKGGNFPCGLIKLAFDNTAKNIANVVIEIDLVPGNHRGYLCESMTEM